ncbi:unnamed protein product [Sphagnum balticum]
MALRIEPTGAVGAELRGIDLRHIDEQTFESIRRAWIDHSVLLFRDQTLSNDELVDFSRRFGSLDRAPHQENGRCCVEGYPEIYVISNVLRDGVPIGSLGAGEAVWHVDMSFLVEPPMASMLYAIEIPPTGGDTSFCNMYTALETLAPELRQRLHGMGLKHDATYNSGGFVRKGVQPTDDPRKSPGTVHPVIARHPESGREVLYLGRRRNAWLVGLDLPESEALLDAIWAHVEHRPDLSWTHRWRVGDLILWDNRCTMHRRDPFSASARRVMHRTQIKGKPLLVV